MNVLITGASGFVGRALAGRLIDAGLQVRGTHRSTPPPPLAGIEWRPLLQLDRTAELTALVAGHEVVVHLAALAHQPGSAGIGRWDEFARSNVEATRILARASREAAVRRFVFVSSVAAVCSHSEDWIDERTPPAPSSDYGRSKLEAERALEAELRGSGTDWCIVRPPLVYGPGNPGNMARLLRLIDRGLPLPFGSIRNRRSFIFIDNLADALTTIVRHPQVIASTYLLSDGSDFATPDLIRALAAAAGRRVRLLRVPVGMVKLLGRAGDLVERLSGIATGIDSYSVDRLVRSLPVSGSLFCSSFGWSAPVAWPEGLRATGAALAASRM